MRIGRDEAADIFRLWLSESCPVRVQGSFSGFAFASVCRVRSIDDLELRLYSDDTDSELVLKLESPLWFGYADRRVVEGEEKQFSECVIFFFSDVPDEGDADTISLAAVR